MNQVGLRLREPASRLATLRPTVAALLLLCGCGKAFKPDRVVFVPGLPKTRSAKIVRRAVRARALGTDPGDLSSLENPEVLEQIGQALLPR